jgi:acetylornithine deacetylase/succinyl-diaminopimelate desuccinylase-like protein
MEQKIKKKINDYQEEMRVTLEELISIPTENPPGRAYRKCANFLSQELTKWGIDHRIIITPRTHPPRLSLIGSFGQGSRCLHFHGHYDVVPAVTDTQFIPQVKKDVLYGRGSSDMKSGLVVILYALRLLKELSLPLNGKIYFSLVPDEETGGQGEQTIL